VLRVAANVVVLVEACTHKKKKPKLQRGCHTRPVLLSPQVHQKLIEKLSDEILIYGTVRRRPANDI